MQITPMMDIFVFQVHHCMFPGLQGEIQLSAKIVADIRDTLYDLAGKIKQLHVENSLSSLRQYLSKDETTIKFNVPTSGFELILNHSGSASLKTKGGTTIIITDCIVELAEVDGKKHVIRTESGLFEDGFDTWSNSISKEAAYWINSS